MTSGFTVWKATSFKKERKKKSTLDDFMELIIVVTLRTGRLSIYLDRRHTPPTGIRMDEFWKRTASCECTKCDNRLEHHVDNYLCDCWLEYSPNKTKVLLFMIETRDVVFDAHLLFSIVCSDDLANLNFSSENDAIDRVELWRRRPDWLSQ